MGPQASPVGCCVRGKATHTQLAGAAYAARMHPLKARWSGERVLGGLRGPKTGLARAPSMRLPGRLSGSTALHGLADGLGVRAPSALPASPRTGRAA
jgi:hypothetical protein